MADEVRLDVPQAQAAADRLRAIGEQFNQIASGLGSQIAASGAIAMTPTGTSGTPSDKIRPNYQPSQDNILQALPQMGQNGVVFADNVTQVIQQQQDNDAHGAALFKRIDVSGPEATGGGSGPHSSSEHSAPRGARA